MVINYLNKLFVTNDAATIIKELEVFHPAAKLLVMASQQQETELGDYTNFVIIFAGELLKCAETLLKMGLKPSEVVEGYEIALKQSMKILEELASKKEIDFADEKGLKALVNASIASKQYGLEEFLTGLVIKACSFIMPKNSKTFNVDNVRVVKVLGSNVLESQVLKGMAFNREPEGVVKKAMKAKVAVYSCPIDVSRTEKTGTVLLHNANEMMNFSKGEEKMIEQQIKEIADSGVKVIVTGGTVGELMLHFINRYELLVVRVQSKFDLRRLCKVVGATPLARLGAPMAEEAGFCDFIEVVEIGSDRCTVFRQEEESSQTVSIVLRGSTLNLLDDLNRSIDDGVNIVKALTKDSRVIPGAGAIEIELSRKLEEFGQSIPGLSQYAIKKFAEAFQVIPRTLAENAGMDSTEVLSKLFAAHQAGKHSYGVDIENHESCIRDAFDEKQPIFDIFNVKSCAIDLATNAALTVLRIDQIIMSKPAGGPKAKESGPQDEDD